MRILSKKVIVFINSLFLLASLNAQAGIMHDFDIQVDFGGGLSLSQQAVFSEAESFWESMIIGYRDGFEGGPLNISASGVYKDGVGGVLGSAGPTLLDFSPSYTYAASGVMTFDSADMDNMESSGSLLDVILHEMAHVIGFGTLWDSNNLLNDDGDYGNYIGEFGLAGYQKDKANPDATFVPVEQHGGPGTAGGHWDEKNGGGDSELMTGWLDSNPIVSWATINSFADLGYVINPDFSVETIVPADPIPEPSSIALFALALFGLRVRKNS